MVQVFASNMTLLLHFGLSFTWQPCASAPETTDIREGVSECHLLIIQPSFWLCKPVVRSAWERGDVTAHFVHANCVSVKRPCVSKITRNDTGRLQSCVLWWFLLNLLNQNKDLLQHYYDQQRHKVVYGHASFTACICHCRLVCLHSCDGPYVGINDNE